MINGVNQTNVPSAGTAVQLSNTANRVSWIKVKARAGNSGLVFLGRSDVSSTVGYELSAGNEIEIDYAASGGTVPISDFYVDAATNNDKICWWAKLDG